jgi:hypothetical protein
MVDNELNTGLIPDYRHSYIFTTVGFYGKQMSIRAHIIKKITVKTPVLMGYANTGSSKKIDGI